LRSTTSHGTHAAGAVERKRGEGEEPRGRLHRQDRCEDAERCDRRQRGRAHRVAPVDRRPSPDEDLDQQQRHAEHGLHPRRDVADPHRVGLAVGVAAVPDPQE